jgi:hypothetical protein
MTAEERDKLRCMKEEIRNYLNERIHQFYYETGYDVMRMQVRIKCMDSGLKNKNIYNVSDIDIAWIKQ